jgi:transposase
VLAFPNLRVLYILVRPGGFDPQAPNEHYIQSYYDACRETQAMVPSKTFLFRDRIYYEMPWKLHRDVVGYEELDLLLYILCWSAKHERRSTDPKLAIRLMTWKYAPGARARFDKG